ncbi:MAG: tetraacyldisaccharide 4'-kinase [Candidatus Omnitrophica bacterium]|nr:tetraacyldisaccharide 4'-kinase [Candidatus Omnitrophota bacterium]
MKEYLYNLATDKNRGFFPEIAKLFLAVLSLIYALIVRLTVYFKLRNQHVLGCKVISVGNITMGGTGKTTLVELIVKYLKSKDKRIAILTRGYKRGVQVKRQENNDSYESMGDEPYMLQSKFKDLPVIVDKNRVRSALRAIRDFKVDTVVLDDGFQQWGIKKDLEIVAIDSVQAFGNQKVLPRGILREPLSSLKRADIFVLTKTDLCLNLENTLNILGRINPQALIVESIHEPLGFYELREPGKLLSVDFLKGEKVSLFSGIGDPGSFERMVDRLGIDIGQTFRFNDHHAYSEADLKKIISESKNKGIFNIITTQKDAVRLLSFNLSDERLRIFVLLIGIKIIKNEERFYSRLFKLYSA